MKGGNNLTKCLDCIYFIEHNCIIDICNYVRACNCGSGQSATVCNCNSNYCG